ncbi:MAG: MBOAT family protein [Bacteroidales bacterium]|nr:MBOAT family protein [Bacteroidales bacterium]
MNPGPGSSVPDEQKGKIEAALRQAASALIRYDPQKPFIFTSPSFWLFMLVALLFFSLVYRRKVARNSYLFLISLFFYYKTGGLFLLLLILVTITDYLAAILINRAERRNSKRFFLLLSLVSNLGMLAYFKYSAFIVSTVNNIFGSSFRVYDYLAELSNTLLGTSFSIDSIILPVGISFFTFQSLSYTIDVYRRKLEPVRNIIDFGFYVSFFPQLVAGPIVRASEFIPQLRAGFSLTEREAAHALFLISKGLVKKIVISDFIALNLIDRVFASPGSFSGFENLVAIYGYGLQIYCDFSGYTDIAIGIALFFGFRLPINFNSPYKAADIADFWRRWHISLSRWLRDYLYIPLGGNRKGWFRTGINLMITMTLGGLWHGASLRFIIWGALHGAALALTKTFNYFFGDGYRRNRVLRAFAVFLTFNFVSFSWVFFRAPDFESIRTMAGQIASSFVPGSWPEVLKAYSSILMLIGAGYFMHLLPDSVKEGYRGLFIRIPLAGHAVFLLLLAVMLWQMRGGGATPFIYFRF